MAAYDAFVSYSHAKDKPIAAALQSVVQRLGKPWYRRRALRVAWPVNARYGNDVFNGSVASTDNGRLSG